MTTDRTAPATKHDFKMLIKEIDVRFEQSEQKMFERVEKSEQTMQMYFGVVIEEMEGRVKMINTEKIFDHDRRIIHLEEATGIRD